METKVLKSRINRLVKYAQDESNTINDRARSIVLAEINESKLIEHKPWKK